MSEKRLFPFDLSEQKDIKNFKRLKTFFEFNI